MDEISTLRAEFQVACPGLIQYLSGDVLIEEDQEDAEEEDDAESAMSLSRIEFLSLPLLSTWFTTSWTHVDT